MDVRFFNEIASKYVSTVVNDGAKVVSELKLKPQLTADTCSFKGTLAKLFERKKGPACTYFDFQKEKEILERLPVFRENNTFGIKEYKSLTSQERQYLDGLLNEIYCKAKPHYMATQEMTRTVNEDADFLIKIADEAKKSLDAKYPQGYKFIGIGGSPSIFSNIYELQGLKAKNVPYSWDVAGADFDYPSYFKKMGLDEKILKNSPEKIVFVDYVKTGKTFDNLKNTLSKNNLIDKDNTEFVSFMNLLERKIPYSDYQTMADFYFENSAIKSFCPCPNMSSLESWRNADKISEAFNWSNSTKLINYGIIKKLEEAGKLAV